MPRNPYRAAAAATILVAGGLAPTLVHSAASAWGGGSGGTCANSGCTTAYAVALPVPKVMTPTSTDATTDYYTVTEQNANLSVIPGKTTPMWTYNGTWPGPLIRATSGRQVRIHVANNLTVPTTLHNHGAHVPPSSDGGPTDTFPTGTTKDYTYPNNQSARTQWFHDHAENETGRNVYMGLEGLYEITDAQEKSFGLPSGAYDVPLVFQDRKFNADGTLSYSPDSKLLPRRVPRGHPVRQRCRAALLQGRGSQVPVPHPQRCERPLLQPVVEQWTGDAADRQRGRVPVQALQHERDPGCPR